METLKVVPLRKALNFVTAVKGGSNYKVGSVINLMFEGNFLPLKVLALLPHLFLGLGFPHRSIY